MIKHRPWQRTDFSTSVVGVGTVKFGRNTNVKNKSADGFKLPDDRILANILDLCLEYGVNYFDTAPAYGLAETRLGKLLVGRRKDFVISTKAGEVYDASTGDSCYDFSAAAVIGSVDNSLRELRTDFIDCLFLHCPRTDKQSISDQETFEALDSLVQAGKIRAYGVSTHTIEAGEYVLTERQAAKSLMLPYNPGFSDHVPIIKKAASCKTNVVVKKGLFSGHLPADNKQELIKSCFTSALEFSAVTSVLVGSINPEHLRENFTLAAEL